MSGNSGRRDDVGEPDREGAPANLNQDTAQTRALIRALENALRDFKDDVSDIKNRAHADFFRILWVFGAGFIILAGMVIGAYRWSSSDLTAATDKIDGRIDRQTGQLETIIGTLSRVDQKIEDLIHSPKPSH